MLQSVSRLVRLVSPRGGPQEKAVDTIRSTPSNRQRHTNKKSRCEEERPGGTLTPCHSGDPRWSLPIFIGNIAQLVHDRIGHLVPYVFRSWRLETLFPAASPSLSSHPPMLISVRVLLVEDAEASSLFFPAHALEARLRHGPFYYIFGIVESCPPRDLLVTHVNHARLRTSSPRAVDTSGEDIR